MSNPSAPGTQRRRSSIAEMFNPRANSTTAVSSSPPTAAVPQASSSSAPKRMSITTLGLGGTSPTASSPFNAFARQRRASMSTASSSGSPEFRNVFGDEPAVIEEDDGGGVPMNTPATPSFARRMSFGAQALRDVRQGGSGPAGGGGEGFNWSEALRDKTKRSPSISSANNPFTSNVQHKRAASAASVASVASVATVEPPKEMPKAPPAPLRMRKPDLLGERMLKGDFMMD